MAITHDPATTNALTYVDLTNTLSSTVNGVTSSVVIPSSDWTEITSKPVNLDLDATNDITTSTSLGGSLSGSLPNPTLSPTGVTAGSYGSATLIPILTIGSDGRITAASSTTVQGEATTVSDSPQIDFSFSYKCIGYN